MQPQILNCMKNFLIGLFALIGTTGISAQTQSITVHSQTTGKEAVSYTHLTLPTKLEV